MPDQNQNQNGNGGAGAGAGSGGAAPWYGESLAPELKTWVDGKGYKDLPSALAAHQAAEKLIGVPADRVIRLPDKPDAPEWGSIWDRLGRPAKPEEYELPTREGDDGEFVKTASGWFHANGVSKAAAQKIAGAWRDYINAAVAKAEEKDQQTSAAALTALRGEWGAASGEREEIARRGLAAFGKQAGLDDKDLISLENSIGTAKMLRMFSEIGKLTNEAGFRAGTTQSFSMTREEAQTKVNQLKADPTWSAAYLKGDKGKLDEMTQLMQIINAA